MHKALTLLGGILLFGNPCELIAAEGGMAKFPPERLAQNLGSGEVESRREAAYYLSRSGAGAKVALAELIKALDDEDKQVWAHAIAAIAAIGPEAADAVPKLIEHLDSSKARGRRQRDNRQMTYRMAHALAKIGPAAIPSLLEALASEDSERRAGAAKAVGGMGALAKPAIPALIKNLEHGDESVRNETAEALALIGAESAPSLASALASNDGRVRTGAARALAEIGPPAAAEGSAMFAAFDKEKDGGIRAALLMALARTGADPDRTVPLLLEAIRGADEPQRHAATNGLLGSKAMQERAVPALLKTLETGDPASRHRAAQVLGRIGPGAAKAVPMLVDRARGEPGEAAYPAALAQIGPAAMRPLLDALAAPGAQPEWIFRTLREMGSPALGVLGDALSAPQPAVRAGAARALGSLPLDAAPAIVTRLGALSADPDPEVRAAALRTLATVRAQRDTIIPKLEAALQDPAGPVRRAAAGGLTSFGAVGKIGVPGLLDLLEDPDIATRRAAVLALAELGPAAAPAIGALADRLGDKELQAGIIEALGRIGASAEAAVPRIAELARGQSEEIRLAALQSLGSIGRIPPGSLGLFYEAMKSSDRDLREAGIKGIATAETDDAKLLPALESALGDESGRIRRLAADRLKLLGDRAQPAVPRLLTMLDRDQDRPIALQALRAVKPREVPRLMTALQHRDPAVRIFACEALGQLGPAAKEAVSALQDKVKGDADGVKEAAKKALEQIGK